MIAFLKLENVPTVGLYILSRCQYCKACESKIYLELVRGGVRNFCLGGQVQRLYIYQDNFHTHLYTYARFFIIYTHFLFDKLYIYTKKKKEFSIFN